MEDESEAFQPSLESEEEEGEAEKEELIEKTDSYIGIESREQENSLWPDEVYEGTTKRGAAGSSAQNR